MVKHICNKPMMGIILNSMELFKIGEFKLDFFCEEWLYSRGSENMLRYDSILLREVFEKSCENMGDILNIGEGRFFSRKISVELRGEVKGIEKGGSSGAQVREWESM